MHQGWIEVKPPSGIKGIIIERDELLPKGQLYKIGFPDGREVMFTDFRPIIEQTMLSWIKHHKHFACDYCTKSFVIGDHFKGIYLNNLNPPLGYALICQPCYRLYNNSDEECLREIQDRLSEINSPRYKFFLKDWIIGPNQNN